MKSLLKIISTLFVVISVLLLSSFLLDYFLVQKATPPKTVVDLRSFFEWKPNPSGAVRITISNSVYYQLLGPAGRTLSSGRAAYAFDANGQFIGWTKDAGDFYEPRIVYSPAAKREMVSVDSVRTNTFEKPMP
jgi:hypothetical protein